MTGDVVRARIDPDLKRDASRILATMGLSLSDAIRLFLVRVVGDEALPFEIRMPNDMTRKAIRDAEAGDVTRFETVDALLESLNRPEPQASAKRPKSRPPAAGRRAGREAGGKRGGRRAGAG